MRTEVRTFKAGDLKNQITILHQRWIRETSRKQKQLNQSEWVFNSSNII